MPPAKPITAKEMLASAVLSDFPAANSKAVTMSS